MTGEELFQSALSEWGEYAQDLMTAHSLIGDKLFPMLEECERTGKKIVIRELTDDPGINDPPLVVVIQ